MAEARIVVAIDPRPAVRGGRVVVREFDQMTRAARKFDLTLKTTTDDRLDRFGRSAVIVGRRLATLRNLFIAVGAAAGVAAAGAGASRFARTADTYALLNARLRLVTNSQQEFLNTQRDTFESAQDTRSALRDTIDLYTDLARRTERFGVAQEDLLDITEAVNQSFRISGTSAAAAAGTIVQLGQAIGTDFAAGGQELNSVLEQAPRLAKALADGLNEIGVTSNAVAADLKRLATEGILNTDTFIRALLSQTERLDDEFKSLPRTAANAGTQLANSFLRAIGRANETADATGSIAEALDEVREIVDSPEFQKGLELIGQAIAFAAGATAELVSNVGELAEAWESIPESVREAVAFGVRAAFNPLDTILDEWDEAVKQIERRLGLLRPEREGFGPAARAGVRGESNVVVARRAVVKQDELSSKDATRIAALLKEFGGPAEQKARIDEMIALVKRAETLGGLTQAQAARITGGIEREFLDQQLAVIGAVDQTLGVTLELEQRRRELKDATDALGLSEVTLARLTDELEDEYADLLEPMAAVTKEFQEQQVAEARARDNQLLSRTLQQLTKDYEANLEAINRLNISEEERAKLRREERLNLLEQRTDLEAGTERFFTKFIQESQDAASAIEAALTEGIDAVNQSLEDLIVTGETSVENLQETLLRRGTRKALETLEAGLFSALGFGGGEDAATTANTTATAANTLALTANTSALLTASAFGGASSALAGASFLGTEVPFASSAIGGNPIATFLGSFQSGGAGRIPGSGPADSVLAMARVTPGEPFAFGGAVGGGEDVAGALRGLTGLLAAIANNTRGTELNLRATGDTFGTAPTIAASDAASLIQNAVRSNSN